MSVTVRSVEVGFAIVSGSDAPVPGRQDGPEVTRDRERARGGRRRAGAWAVNEPADARLGAGDPVRLDRADAERAHSRAQTHVARRVGALLPAASVEPALEAVAGCNREREDRVSRRGVGGRRRGDDRRRRRDSGRDCPSELIRPARTSVLDGPNLEDVGAEPEPRVRPRARARAPLGAVELALRRQLRAAEPPAKGRGARYPRLERHGRHDRPRDDAGRERPWLWGNDRPCVCRRRPRRAGCVAGPNTETVGPERQASIRRRARALAVGGSVHRAFEPCPGAVEGEGRGGGDGGAQRRVGDARRRRAVCWAEGTKALRDDDAGRRSGDNGSCCACRREEVTHARADPSTPSRTVLAAVLRAVLLGIKVAIPV